MAEAALLAAVFLAPFRSYALGSVFGFTLSAFRLAVLITGISALGELFAGRLKATAPRRVAPVGFLLLMAIAAIMGSVIYSQFIAWGDATSRLLGKAFGLCFLIMAVFLFARRDTVRRMYLAFLLSGMLPVLIGAWQLLYFLSHGTFPALPLSQLSVLGSGYTGSGLGTMYGQFPRLVGSFLEPNYFGQYLAMLLLMLFYGLGLVRGRLKRRMLVLYACAVAVELVFTLSLSAMAGLVAGALVAFVTDIAVGGLKSTRVARLVGVLLLAVIVLASPLGRSMVDALQFRLYHRSADVSTLFGRSTFFHAVIQALEASPVFGVGFGGLFEFLPSNYTVASGHSALLTVLAEQGIFGFTVIVGWFVLVGMGIMRAFFEASQNNNNEDSRMCLGLIAAFVSLLVANVGYDAMFSYDASWSLLAMVSIAGMPGTLHSRSFASGRAGALAGLGKVGEGRTS